MSEYLPIDHGGPVDWPFEPFPVSALKGSIVDRFDAIAHRFSARLAIGDGAHSFTYAALARLVDRIARGVVAATGENAGPIALLLANDARYSAAMLGALAAGRGYIPLDADHPVDRNRSIATQAGAVAVVSAGDLAEKVRSLFPHDLPVLNIEKLNTAALLEPSRRPGPDDLACIVYTSGSTGTPKDQETSEPCPGRAVGAACSALVRAVRRPKRV